MRSTGTFIRIAKMPIDIDWVKSVIEKVRQRGPKMPDAVWAQIEALLRGQFSRRQLSPMDLAKDAKRLIDAATPAPPSVADQQ